MLQFIRSETHPKNIFFINAESLQDKLDLGAMLSLYSNCSKDAETLYNDKFLNSPSTSDELHDKLFGQNGDTFTSELVPHGFAVCMENIPILWAVYISHYRTLLVVEKGDSFDDASKYYKPIKNNTTNIYDVLCKKRIDDHKKHRDIAFRKLSMKVENKDLENSSIIKTLKVRAFDETKHYLPFSTLTGLGIVANLRSWLHVLSKEKVRNNTSLYVTEVIDPLIDLFKQYFPVVFSDANLKTLQETEKTIFMSEVRSESEFGFDDSGKGNTLNPLVEVELKFPPNSAAVLNYRSKVKTLKRTKKMKPVRDTEMLDFTIVVPGIDIVTFRDFQRHTYFSILINKWENYQLIEEELILLSSPISTPIDITIKGNLRQWTHAIELNTLEQGHYKFRQIIQKCGALISKELEIQKEELFPFADWRDYANLELGSLKAELKGNNRQDE